MSGAASVVAAALLWGLWPLWIRGGPGGPAVAAIALSAAAIAGLPLALRESRGRPRRARREWLLLAVLGLADVANLWCYFRALDEGTVAPAVLSHYLAPVLVALAAPHFLAEPRAARTPLALALALAGTAALVLGGPGPLVADRATLFALGFGGASAIFYALLVVLSKRLARSFGDAELLVYHILVSAAVLAMLVLGGGSLGSWSQMVKPAIGGLVSTLIAGLLYYRGLRRIPAERAAILAYLEPLAAVLVGWIAFHEVPSAAAAAGGALILAGGLLVAIGPAR